MLVKKRVHTSYFPFLKTNRTVRLSIYLNTKSKIGYEQLISAQQDCPENTLQPVFIKKARTRDTHDPIV